MIVKIQRPISTTHDKTQFLLYDEDRTFVYMPEVESDEGLALCAYFDSPDDLEPPLKVYVEGDLDEEGHLTLGELADDQEPGW